MNFRSFLLLALLLLFFISVANADIDRLGMDQRTHVLSRSDLPAPENLQATDCESIDAITLTWSPVRVKQKGAIAYEVFRCSATQSEDMKKISKLSIRDTTYKDTDIPNKLDKYLYCVIAIQGSRSSAESNRDIGYTCRVAAPQDTLENGSKINLFFSKPMPRQWNKQRDLSFNIIVENPEGLLLPQFNFRLYLSVDQELDTSDLLLKEETTKNIKGGTINRYNLKVGSPITDLTPGKYYLLLVPYVGNEELKDRLISTEISIE